MKSDGLAKTTTIEYNSQIAGITQSAECQICNLNVVGATPTTGFILPSSLTDRARDFGSLGCRFESYLGILFLGSIQYPQFWCIRYQGGYYEKQKRSNFRTKKARIFI